MKKKKPKTKALLLLGMHRSGTSAAARLCNLLGAYIGETLIPARRDNVKGFWEHKDIVAIHDRLLTALHSSWDDTRGLPEGWWKQQEIKPFAEEIRTVLKRDFTGSSLWMVKDPRLCLFLPLWKDILGELGVEPYVILMLRHPASVAESLLKRDVFLREKSLLLWCIYMMQAERDSRSMRRAILPLDSLMRDWQGAMGTVALQLELRWPIRYGEVVEEVQAFLDPTLLHTQDAMILCDDPLIAGWTRALYTLFSSSKLDQKAFDSLYQKVWHFLSAHRAIISAWVEETLDFRRGYADQLRHAKGLEEKISRLEVEIEERRQVCRHEEWKNKMLEYRLASVERDYFAVMGSTAWRMTWPWRAGGTLLRRSRILLLPGTWHHMRQIWKKEGPQGLFQRAWRLCRRNRGILREDYEEWVRTYDTITVSDRESIRRHIETFSRKPMISIVMPVYNTEERWLRQSIESVCKQLYPHWELCIADDCSTAPHIKPLLQEYARRDKRIHMVFRDANGHISECSNSALALAKGEFVALLDHDDLLPEHALYRVAYEINAHPETDLIYSDEDKVDANGRRYGPYFKSDWNIDLFFGHNMFSHLGVYRKTLLDRIGGFRKGYEGSQDYDLCLRCLPLTTAKKIRHIPQVLYHWRAIPGSTALANEEKDYAKPNSDRALADYFSAQHLPARILPAKHHVHRRVGWALPDPPPLVSIIMPTRNGYRMLEKAVNSVQEVTRYPHYEILIVDNRSDDPETLAYLKRMGREPHIRVLPYDASFNFSAINNMSASKAHGDVLAFLNNDVEVITPDWLEEMVAQALRSDVGAVGAMLYYPDDTVQHGGLVLGTGEDGIASTLSIRLPRKDYGYLGRAALAQELSAVTAACMVMRRKVFEEVGGFDAEHFTIAYNDVDLCLRLRHKGYRIVWTPFAELYHHESATRGSEDTPEKQARFKHEAEEMRKRWGGTLTNDPFYNPNLNITVADFSLAFPPRLKYPWKV